MKLSVIALMAGFCLVVGFPMAATAGPATSADGADADGIGQDFDNCTLRPNSDQRDTDHDGCGDLCDFDWNNDGIIKLGELAKANANAGAFPTVANADCDAPPGPPFFNCECDINHDGICKLGELAQIGSLVGKRSGPSGLPSRNTAICGCPLASGCP
jgi:hypothetical protein